MIQQKSVKSRPLRNIEIATDLIVIGGGLAGLCCAITAARAGSKVVLVQDRPVLGGNASSEVRLWILGATSHLGNNNRWSREGGVIDEILLENVYRNPEGNPVLVDALLLEKVVDEKNITLLLNTAVYSLEKSGPDTISAVEAFNAQNSTHYKVAAPLFCDASGDGIAGFLAGAAFRIGAESRHEFGEKMAPAKANTDLLGHTIYFYSKDTGRPVKFVAPSFALDDITAIPRFGDFNARDIGCKLWWLEWGGRLDTVHDTELIKWELWKVAYGAWNHIKNSGKYPEAETLTLEWVGTIPGKRESRRFEGDYLLTQQDVIKQREHADAVSFGGWAIDLHPSDGVYSQQQPCTQWHAKGVYQIPYRCLYSRNIKNLFLAGRIISVTHIAFGSTRVMATCAHSGQAVGMAAVLCRKHGILPRQLLRKPYLAELQRELLLTGQVIPRVALRDPLDLAQAAMVTCSSELKLTALQPGSGTRVLQDAVAMLLPVPAGRMPRVSFLLDVASATRLRVELRASGKPGNFTPDVVLKKLTRRLGRGRKQWVTLDFKTTVNLPQYLFVCLMENETVSAHLSDQRVTGVLFVTRKFNRAVAKSPRQAPPPDRGIEIFEFWIPERYPSGKNLALRIDPPLFLHASSNVLNGFGRPTGQTNAWASDFDDKHPTLTLSWPTPQTIQRIELEFDTDFDHPLESVLMGHPKRVMPFCIPSFNCFDGEGSWVYHHAENHQSRASIRLEKPITTSKLLFGFERQSVEIPATLFGIRCYRH